MLERALVCQAKNLSKSFGDFLAVDKVNIDVVEGEIFGFLGPNGSGKTTTIRMLLGLLPPSAGNITVLGNEMGYNTRQIHGQIGYMSQKFSLYNDLTVLQNLNFYGSAYGLSPQLLKTRIADALDMAELKGHENTQTKHLSGGWRQRLALSAAILHRPKLLFLDEPTAGVDPISRRAFWSLLYKLVAEKVTVFVTTHYMDEAEHCHRMAFIQRGKLIAYGTPEEIKSTKMKGQILEIKPKNLNQAMAALRNAQENKRISVIDIQLYGALIHCTVKNAEQDITSIQSLFNTQGVEFDQIQNIEPSLEDVFIASMDA